MAGRVQGRAQRRQQDLGARFQYDLQLTQTDLFADNFFSYLTDVCRQNMEFMTEGYYGPFDPIRCDGRTARPMGEFWASGDCMKTIRWAASAATDLWPENGRCGIVHRALE